MLPKSHLSHTMLCVASLQRFSLFDSVLDSLFLHLPLLGTRPPHRSLVFALDIEVCAGVARRVALVALFSP